MAVRVFFRTRPPRSAGELEPRLRRAVLAALGRKKTAGAVNLVITGEAEIRRLNRAFLSRSGSTDVIAFNHPAPGFIPPGETPPFGDIYVCRPVARRQAAGLGHSLETELLILAVHGALHLAGMHDSTAALRRAMNQKTVRILKKLA